MYVQTGRISQVVDGGVDLPSGVGLTEIFRGNLPGVPRPVTLWIAIDGTNVICGCVGCETTEGDDGAVDCRPTPPDRPHILPPHESSSGGKPVTSYRRTTPKL